MTTVVDEPISNTDRATVPITSVYLWFLARVKLDHERVKFMEEQIQTNDPHLRPILVGETPESPEGRYPIIDGRHRFDAYRNLKYEAIPVVITRERDPAKLMAMALAANLEGAPQLPPNMDDINQAMRNLVAAGKSDQWIQAELHNLLPAKMIAKATQWARSNRTKGLIRQAANYRDEKDCSFADAAKQFDVSPEALKEFVTKKKRSGDHANAEIAKDLTILNQTYGSGLSAIFQRMTENVRDAVIEVEDAKRHAQRVSDYRHRIQVQCDTFLQRLDKEIH